MRIKAYHSNSVESAIRQARLELGDDAILLDSKKSGPAQRHLGLYEVRFVLGGPGTAERASAPNTSASEASRASAAGPPPSEVERAFRRAMWAGPVRPSPARPAGAVASAAPVSTSGLTPAVVAGESVPQVANGSFPRAARSHGFASPGSSNGVAAPAASKDFAPTAASGRLGSRAPSGGLAAQAHAGSLGELSRGIEEIRRMLYSYTQTCYLPTRELTARPLLAQVYQELAANEVSPELAAQLVAGLTGAVERGSGRAQIERDLIETIERLVPVAPEVGRSGSAAPQMVALVGPTGAGKTTTLAKLAVEMGLEKRRRVHLLSADNHRIGAFHQIETYAEIFGVGCTAVDEAGELAAALEGLRRAGDGPLPPGQPQQGCPDLVLIDTPGYSANEIENAAALAAFLRSSPEIDTHLVLSASTKPRDLGRSIEQYRVFGPRKLLFTKLDETHTFGPLLNEAVRTGWPLSFLGSGQRIPEDLLRAEKALMAELVWTGRLPTPIL